MQNSEELKEIYESRYSDASDGKGIREIALYKKYRKLLIKQRTKENSKLLDLGCGIGFKTIGFSVPNEQVLAIDLSENAITFCKNQHKNELIEFKAMDAFEVTGEFNVISAFGFSLFNTDDNNRFLAVFNHFYKTNLLKESKSTIVIGSFTDFSGKGKDSWYLHTKEDLDYIQQEIEKQFPVKVSIVFPHKLLNNYFGSGFYNFAAESIKLLIKQKRTFFIRIEHE